MSSFAPNNVCFLIAKPSLERQAQASEKRIVISEKWRRGFFCKISAKNTPQKRRFLGERFGVHLFSL